MRSSLIFLFSFLLDFLLYFEDYSPLECFSSSSRTVFDIMVWNSDLISDIVFETVSEIISDTDSVIIVLISWYDSPLLFRSSLMWML